jgi:hypothetical protein
MAEASLLSDVVREHVFHILVVFKLDDKLLGQFDVVLPIGVVADVVNAELEHSVLLVVVLGSNIVEVIQGVNRYILANMDAIARTAPAVEFNDLTAKPRALEHKLEAFILRERPSPNLQGAPSIYEAIIEYG